MEKTKLLIYKLLIAFFLISQYQTILKQNNFLGMASYTSILILLSIDFLTYFYKNVFRKKE